MRPFVAGCNYFLSCRRAFGDGSGGFLLVLFLDRLALGCGSPCRRLLRLLSVLHGPPCLHASGFALAECAGCLALFNTGLLVGLALMLGVAVWAFAPKAAARAAAARAVRSVVFMVCSLQLSGDDFESVCGAQSGVRRMTSQRDAAVISTLAAGFYIWLRLSNRWYAGAASALRLYGIHLNCAIQNAIVASTPSKHSIDRPKPM